MSDIAVAPTVLPSNTDAKILELHRTIPASPIKFCLATVSCKLNVKMHEEKMAGIYKATAEIPIVKSNFGTDIHSSCPTYIKKSHMDKLAKKMKKRQANTKKTKRKIVGDGSCMNSCVSYMVISLNIPNHYYDVKRFRTGKVQIPGCINMDLVDINTTIETIIKYERTYFPEVAIEEPLYINMMNYKFLAHQEYGINLTTLMDKINNDKEKYKQLYPSAPKLSIIKYTPGNSIMYVEFLTPTDKRPTKHMTVAISHNGKCVIQGGIADDRVQYNIYEYMLCIFRNTPEIYTTAADLDDVDGAGDAGDVDGAGDADDAGDNDNKDNQ